MLTAGMVASKEGYNDCVIVLIERGLDVNHTDSVVCLPFFPFQFWCDLRLMLLFSIFLLFFSALSLIFYHLFYSLLVQHSKSMIMWASSTGHTNVVTTLLQRNANPNMKTNVCVYVCVFMYVCMYVS